MQKSFYSHGKLLLSAEYLILDGAEGLAVPTKKGQTLSIIAKDTPGIQWKSIDYKGKSWFEDSFVFDNNHDTLLNTSSKDNAISNTLVILLNEARKLNPDFLNSEVGYSVVTTLEFPREWGLGSSSTLINNIANWAEVNPYTLLWNAFGGSGYDIACAGNDQPIIYQIKEKVPIVSTLEFNPSFKDQLYFIYLNEKQNSRDAIAHYKKFKGNKTESIQKVSKITTQLSKSSLLSEFEILIEEHEELISSIIEILPIKKRLFNDYEGAIKSLGAWGGDFILVTASYSDMLDYFKKKGFNTIIPYSQMVL